MGRHQGIQERDPQTQNRLEAGTSPVRSVESGTVRPQVPKPFDKGGSIGNDAKKKAHRSTRRRRATLTVGIIIVAGAVLLCLTSVSDGEKSTRSKFWKERAKVLSKTLKSDHVTRKDVTEQNYRHLSTNDGMSIPPPSGRGEDSDGTAKFKQMMNDIHSFYAENYVNQRNRRQLVWKIDTWLAQRGSPMVGCAEYYVQGQERTGIPATLPVGIAEAESTSGMACFAPFNAFGMIAPAYQHGFGSWEEGIRANFDWLVHYHGCPQTMHDCPGYCEGNGTMSTVDAVMRMIDSLDASGVK